MSHFSSLIFALGFLFFPVLIAQAENPAQQADIAVTSAAQVATPYYFDEHLDEGTLVSAPVAAAEWGGDISLFEADKPLGWTALKRTSQCGIVDGVLVLSGGDGGSFLSPGYLGLYGPVMLFLKLRMAVSGTDEVKISWRPKDTNRDWLKEDSSCVFRLPIPEQNKEIDYDIRLDELPGWKSTNIDQLQLSAEGAFEIRVRSMRVVTRIGLFSEHPFGKCRYAFGGAARQCLFQRCPATVEYRVHVPAKGCFSALLGVVDESNPVTFRVNVRDGTVENPLFFREVASGKRWEPVEVDLESYANKDITLVLRAEALRHGQVALWGTACVYAARAPFSEKEAGPAGGHPNILIYMVDALRADHLSLYGYHRDTAPNLTSFAANATRFERCFSQSTCTTPSTSSMMSGVDSLRHGLMCFTGSSIPPDLVTLPELLRSVGYVTGAVSENSFTPPPDGGREAYRHIDMLDEVDSCVNGSTYSAIGDFLENNQNRPFFLYVHTMECHGRRAPGRTNLGYSPPEPWRSIWASPEKASLADAYDASIVLADYNFGQLLKKLETLGLAANTVVIFSADHGERLNDRNDESGHGFEPFQDQIHVPLLVRHPAISSNGRVVSENVQLLDLAPSVLDMCGLPLCRQFQGQSLRPLMTGGDCAPFQGRTIFSFSGWSTTSAAVIRGDWKFMLDTSWASTPYLFNLKSDPDEKNNEIWLQAAMADELFGILLDHSAKQLGLRAHGAAAAPDVAQSPMNPVDAEQLESLGYLGR